MSDGIFLIEQSGFNGVSSINGDPYSNQRTTDYHTYPIPDGKFNSRIIKGTDECVLLLFLLSVCLLVCCGIISNGIVSINSIVVVDIVLVIVVEVAAAVVVVVVV